MKNKAFTLVETLVAIFIFTLLAAGVTVLFKQIYGGSLQEETALGNVDQARVVEFNFVNEVRNAAEGIDGSFPIGQAGDNQIILYSTYDSGTTTVDRVRYYVASSTLYRGIVAPSGNPLAYNLASEVITPVQGGIASTSIALFSYYDGNYAGTSTPLTQPVNVNQVKFISMNLSVLKQDERNGTSTFYISEGANLRNEKTNLGS